jgi:hypothetical protein
MDGTAVASLRNLLRGSDLFSFERGMQRMPRERSAFDPSGETRDTRKNSQLAKALGIVHLGARHDSMKFIEELFRLLRGFAF